MRIEKSNQNYSKLSIIFKILPDLQWSKQKPIKKIISRSYLSYEKQKNAFFKQNDVRKIILESKPTTRGG
jgi:hypothetical protein